MNERDSLEFEPVLTGAPEQTLLNPNGSLNFAGNSVGRPFYNKDLNNFAPSVGLGVGSVRPRNHFGSRRVRHQLCYGRSHPGSRNVHQHQSGIGRAPSQISICLGSPARLRLAISTPAFQAPLSFAEGYNRTRECITDW